MLQTSINSYITINRLHDLQGTIMPAADKAEWLISSCLFMAGSSGFLDPGAPARNLEGTDDYQHESLNTPLVRKGRRFFICAKQGAMRIQSSIRPVRASSQLDVWKTGCIRRMPRQGAAGGCEPVGMDHCVNNQPCAEKTAYSRREHAYARMSARLIATEWRDHDEKIFRVPRLYDPAPVRGDESGGNYGRQRYTRKKSE